MPQVNCQNLTLGYEGRTVLKDLSFTVEKGAYLCIVGENGAGKSTLIKALLNLKKPMAGTIAFLEGLTPAKVGYLPQQNAAQKDFPASVWEVVLSGTESQGKTQLLPFHTKAQKADAAQALATLGIENLKKSSFQNLSGGQQQRVLLARALLGEKELLVLDEPTAGLDPAITAELYRQIEQVNQSGVTVIMVSHDVEIATRYASHILHLSGKKTFCGTAAEYKNSAAYKYLLGGEEVV